MLAGNPRTWRKHSESISQSRTRETPQIFVVRFSSPKIVSNNGGTDVLVGFVTLFSLFLVFLCGEEKTTPPPFPLFPSFSLEPKFRIHTLTFFLPFCVLGDFCFLFWFWFWTLIFISGAARSKLMLWEWWVVGEMGIWVVGFDGMTNSPAMGRWLKDHVPLRWSTILEFRCLWRRVTPLRSRHRCAKVLLLISVSFYFPVTFFLFFRRCNPIPFFVVCYVGFLRGVFKWSISMSKCSLWLFSS